MIIRSFKYKDLSGLEREEECYFNLSEAEILELQTTHEGGFVEELQRVIKMQDQPAIARLLKKFILDSTKNKPFICLTTDLFPMYRNVSDEIGVNQQLCTLHLF